MCLIKPNPKMTQIPSVETVCVCVCVIHSTQQGMHIITLPQQRLTRHMWTITKLSPNSILSVAHLSVLYAIRSR